MTYIAHYRSNGQSFLKESGFPKQHPAPWLKPEDDGKDKVEGVDFYLRKRGIYWKGRYHYICKICSNEFADVDTLLCKQCSDETITVPITTSPSEQQREVKAVFVDWQLCPKCNGDGHLMRYNSPPFISTNESAICDVCNGAKIIAKAMITSTPPSGSDAEAVEILKELCRLEYYKDVLGKDAFYEKTQPELWKRANDFLNSKK